jgi:hypothetical protein
MQNAAQIIWALVEAKLLIQLNWLCISDIFKLLETYATMWQMSNKENHDGLVETMETDGIESVRVFIDPNMRFRNETTKPSYKCQQLV